MHSFTCLRHVFTSVTFFKFVKIAGPDRLLDEIKPAIDDTCKSYDVKVICTQLLTHSYHLLTLLTQGTIVIAKEGFNGQLCIPTVKLSAFIRSLSGINSIFYDIPDLINYGTVSLTHSLIQLFFIRSLTDFHLLTQIGTTNNYDSSSIPYPYKRLIIRTKQNILTDGLPESVANDLDWLLILYVTHLLKHSLIHSLSQE